MWSDPVVTRFIGGKPSTRHQTWMRILNYAGHWKLRGFGYWVVEDKSTGSYIGEVGFADFKREIAPSMRDVPELGWALATSAHGRGYGTEAVRAAAAWGDRHFQNTRTVCLITPENSASVHVAEKCGYAEFERSELGSVPVVFFERVR